MNKQELLSLITNNVRKKHPWKISQDKYVAFFGELPYEFTNERIVYDNLLEKSKQFKLCHLVLSEVKVEIRLSLDQCITWEIARYEEAGCMKLIQKYIVKNGMWELIDDMGLANKEEKESKIMNPRALEIGDTVKLKSGGPLMTVNTTNYNDKPGMVYCGWFNDGNEMKGYPFHQDTLNLQEK
jgi:uncharacterized protein YodC (DUF2158 family)